MIPTDEIRARGMGVEILPVAEPAVSACSCGGSKPMDDLHRLHIGRLNRELAEEVDLRDSLVADLVRFRRRESVYRLALFALGFALALGAASDAGWLDRFGAWIGGGR